MESTRTFLEIRPGQWVNLAAVVEIADDPASGELFLVLPGIDEDGGPSGHVVSGETRVAVLRWVRGHALLPLAGS